MKLLIYITLLLSMSGCTNFRTRLGTAMQSFGQGMQANNDPQPQVCKVIPGTYPQQMRCQ